MAADRFEFADGQVEEGLGGVGWLRADDARKWIELARDGEAKFREARERALVTCRRVRDASGPSGMINASQVLNLLSLTWPDGNYESSPNLQPEAAGNWGPGGPADRRPPSVTALPVGSRIRAQVKRWGSNVSEWPADTSDVTMELAADKIWYADDDDPAAPFAVTQLSYDAITVLEVLRHGPAVAEAANPLPEPPAVSMQQRRNVRIGERDLHALLDLGESDQIRSAHVTNEPFALYVSVVGPDWDPILYDSEAPILEFFAKRLFHSCLEGNRMGECVLADGHEKQEYAEIGRGPQWLHVDRWGQAWGVAANG